MQGFPDLAVRSRRDEDLPTLERLLAEQQSVSRYPTRWPLPYPVQQFLVGPDAVVGPALSATAGDGTFARLTVLFVGLGEAGRGVGRRLHDTAVAR